MKTTVTFAPVGQTLIRIVRDVVDGVTPSPTPTPTPTPNPTGGIPTPSVTPGSGSRVDYLAFAVDSGDGIWPEDELGYDYGAGIKLFVGNFEYVDENPFALAEAFPSPTTYQIEFFVVRRIVNGQMISPVQYGPRTAPISFTLAAANGGGTPTPTPTPPASGDEDVLTFTISPATLSKAEGNSGSTPYDFTITRQGGLSQALAIGWVVTGKGSNPASAADFTGNALPTGTASFAANATTATATVNVSGDSTVEPDEQFEVKLAATCTVTLNAQATATGTITNDDVSSAPADQSVTTFDQATKNAFITLSNGNLTMVGNPGVGAYMSVKSTSSKGTLNGDSYFEAVCTGADNFIQGIGLVPASVATAGNSFGEIGFNTVGIMWRSDGDRYSIGYNNAAGDTVPSPPVWGANNDVVGCLLRTTMSGSTPAYKVFYHKNGVWINATGDPYASGAGIAVATTDPLFAAATTKGEDVFTYRFKASEQTYKPASANAWGA